MRIHKSGCVFLRKQSGCTSFETLKFVKSKLSTRKVGHVGTLDKFANGLLIALTGKLTKFARFLEKMDKQYRAEIVFGVQTDTLDPEGQETAYGRIPTEHELRETIPLFLGEIQQIPPRYSAIHVNGKRASKLMREGKTVNLHPRSVVISKLELLEWKRPVAVFDIACSKGTYVRALARDIADRVGTYAYVSSLTRTRIGDFYLDDGVEPDKFDPLHHLMPPVELVSRIPDISILPISEVALAAIKNGGKLKDNYFLSPPKIDGVYCLVDNAGTAQALIERSKGEYSYIFVLNS